MQGHVAARRWITKLRRSRAHFPCGGRIGNEVQRLHLVVTDNEQRGSSFEPGSAQANPDNPDNGTNLTSGQGSGTLTACGKADVMKIRHFPAAIIAAAIPLSGPFASSSVAQESATSTPTEPPPPPPPVVERVQLSGGAEDVLKLSKAKVNDDVIIAFVQNGNRNFSLSATEILYLRNQGVSDRVLTAMLGQTPPPPASPAESESNFAAQASAPQYISSPTTSYVETPSTVYVGTPSYYSFYDPWPYWSTWYAYPAFSFGFYWGWGWGGCGYWSYPSYCYPKYNYCYSGSWNNYCNGYYSSTAVRVNSRPVATGNQALVSEMRQPSGVSRGRPLVSEMRQPSGVNQGNALVSEGRQPSGVGGGNQANTRSRINRVENRSAPGRAQPTSFFTGNNQTATPRPGSETATAPSVRTRTVSSGDPGNNRIPASRPVENGARQPSRPNITSSRPTTAFNGTSQRPAAPTFSNQRGASISRPSVGASRGPSTSFSRPATPVSRSVASPSASFQRSSSPGFRSSGSMNVSRPSMSAPSFSSRSSSGAFRGGGFSGGSRSMASSGGGFRGGGGGRGR